MPDDGSMVEGDGRWFLEAMQSQEKKKRKALSTKQTKTGSRGLGGGAGAGGFNGKNKGVRGNFANGARDDLSGQYIWPYNDSYCPDVPLY